MRLMLFSGKHCQPTKWPHRTIFGYHSRRTTGKSLPPFLPSFLFPVLILPFPSRTQMGEFFGYSVAAADLNGDG